jgi:hypothetical protein
MFGDGEFGITTDFESVVRGSKPRPRTKKSEERNMKFSVRKVVK